MSQMNLGDVYSTATSCFLPARPIQFSFIYLLQKKNMVTLQIFNLPIK